MGCTVYVRFHRTISNFPISTTLGWQEHQSCSLLTSMILEPTLQSVQEFWTMPWAEIPALKNIADEINDRVMSTQLYPEDVPGLTLAFDSANFEGIYEPTEVKISSAKLTASGEVLI